MKPSIAQTVRALAVLLLFVPAPLGAVAPAPAVADSPATTLLAQPAVEVPEDVGEEEEQPWTMRYLAPATVVIAVVTAGAALAYYVVRIRGRYRVVE